MAKKQFDYFGSLEHLAKNASQAAVVLDELITEFSITHLMTCAEKIHNLEREADQIVQDILNELYDSFITPIDREDIVEITERLDDVIDGINATTYMMENLNITSIRPNSNFFSKFVVDVTSGVLTATKEFAKFKNSKTLKKMIHEVNLIESQADKLYSELIKELFTKEKDPIEIIKWKDIYDQLEDVVNTSEDVVDIIAGLVIKNT